MSLQLALHSYPVRSFSIDTNARVALFFAAVGLLATVSMALAGFDVASISDALTR
jgi:hypothetical protein